MHGFAAEPGWRHPGLGNRDRVLRRGSRRRLIPEA